MNYERPVQTATSGPDLAGEMAAALAAASIKFQVFNFTKGGLIQLNHGRGQPLQYVANAAFLASLFVDYMNATGVPGWNCGPNFISFNDLHPVLPLPRSIIF
ncbi:hypothetical protein HAX54_008503 [Datura stramonium]|uniref:Cellulase n=1 Tax=Datura stramonium TaxID=4076 RepID=A0ABS8TDH1_DATST|nr:hypothetical protein [Datura stramonium]